MYIPRTLCVSELIDDGLILWGSKLIILITNSVSCMKIDLVKMVISYQTIILSRSWCQLQGRVCCERAFSLLPTFQRSVLTLLIWFMLSLTFAFLYYIIVFEFAILCFKFYSLCSHFWSQHVSWSLQRLSFVVKSMLFYFVQALCLFCHFCSILVREKTSLFGLLTSFCFL